MQILSRFRKSGFTLIELRGAESNRDAIGARIRATVAGVTQVLEICGGDGYFASNERRQTIGLGTATRVELLEIIWPSGRVQRWTDVPAGGLLRVVEGQEWRRVRPASNITATGANP